MAPAAPPLAARTAGAPPDLLQRPWASRVLAGGYMLAAALTVFAVTRVASPGRAEITAASRDVVVLLLINLVLILLLAGVVGVSVLRLFARRAEAGSRLHLRFVSLFALAAVAPAVVVALFFGVLVTQAVEGWFGRQVRTVVEDSATVARAYIREQTATLSNEMQPMVGDLNQAAPLLGEGPVAYARLLEAQAAARNLTALYVLDSEGRVLASAEAAGAPAYLSPPPDSLGDARSSLVVSEPVWEDVIRALQRLDGYPDAFLYVVQRLDPGVLSKLRQAEASVVAYRAAEESRERIQAAFALSYAETVLLVLVGAVWLGLGAAGRISGPVGRLVEAAGRVSAGDLSARVETKEDAEEIAVLSRAFNRMTEDLEAQQQALRSASEEAENRRRFIETVLADVSAGVIRVDAEGRVTALNRSAAKLLELDAAAAFGQPLTELAPELRSVSAVGARTPREAEEAELDIVRGGETLRLRLRAGQQADGGWVLTFDDITRLLAAQRVAAWRDVARRIAHEIKNPLTPIMLSAERIRRKYRKEITSDLETFDRCTDTIVRQVGDIGRMVDEFSSFARMPAPAFAEADLAELLRQSVFAQRVASPAVTWTIADSPERLTALCDVRMVGQALTNVLKNAGESVGARVAQTPEPPGAVTAHLTLDGACAIFCIDDNGLGLPVKDRERLTEPYVTTREKGTGLGLAIVKRILEDHGGDLRLQDAPPPLGGARVVMRLAVGAAAGVSRPAVAAE